MMPPPLPDDEAQRLAELHQLDILDTAPEQGYDDLVRIAAAVCGTPMSLVSLVDAQRQWFKSRIGLDADETPRTVSFCAHAIADPQQLFVVSDARDDPRFADNPLVLSAPNIRFYAGAPLTTSTGHALGTLCVIDSQPRELQPYQREALLGLSRQAAALLELRRTTKRLQHELAERAWYERQLQQHRREMEATIATLTEETRTDALTGTANRRALASAFDAAARGVHRPAFLLVDVDHFKRINDSRGHDAGDRVLVAVAGALQAALRRGDVVARIGGEEFAVLAPVAAPAEALQLAERLRETVAGLPVAPGVTVSLGLALLQPGEPFAAVYARADAALYAAKQAGRNRVAVAADADLDA